MRDMHQPVAAVPTRPIRWGRLAPGGVAALLSLVVPAVTGAPPWSVLYYDFWLVVGVIVPGVLLARLLIGRQASLVEELSWGAVVGLLWQIVGWVLFVGLGVGPWLPIWPLVTIGVFIAIPSLHQHIPFRRYPVLMSRAVAWALVVLFAWAGWAYRELFVTAQVPPAPNQWYQDQYWHLALTAMLKRQIVPETPQVADLPLTYHWLPNVHLAVMNLTTGIDLSLILVRLWVLPILALLLGMFVVVLRTVVSHDWAAVVAAALTIGSAQIALSGWYQLPGHSPLAVNSPSQTYSLVFVLAAVALLMKLLDGVRLGRWWILLVSILVVSPGMKSSSLPLILCGLALALFVAIVTRASWRPALMGLGLVLLVLLTVGRFLGGGAGGANYQLGSTIRRSMLWASFVGLDAGQRDFPVGRLLPGLQTHGAWLLLALIVFAYVIKFAYALPGLVALRTRAGAWLLLGIAIGGWAAMMIIDHDGQSQIYFLNTGVLGLHVLTGWGAAEMMSRVPSRLARRAIGAIVGSVVLGWVGVLLVRGLGPQHPEPRQFIAAMGAPLAVGAVIIGLALAGWLLATSRGVPWASLVGVALSGGLLGAAFFVPVSSLDSSVRNYMASMKKPRVLTARQVTSAEVQAAWWLRANSKQSELVATNVHCLEGVEKTYCDARAFWVGGFTERPVLIEGWGYTDAAHEQHGVGGRRYANQPFDDAALFSTNERVFADPTKSGIEELRSRGVRWLFADLRRGQVSSVLGTLVTERFRNTDVAIYRLDP